MIEFNTIPTAFDARCDRDRRVLSKAACAAVFGQPTSLERDGQVNVCVS